MLLKEMEFLGPFRQSISSIIGVAVLILLYSLYVKFIEKRKATEFSTSRMIAETGYGLFVGSGIMVLIVFIMFVSGYYRIDGFNSNIPYYINYIFIFTIAALAEELVFRLILFRLMEELLGTWTAIFSQILLFGFLHGANPNATFWSSLAIGIEAGILLSAVYMYTRRMWLALALHMAWNYTQGIIFGIRVSGIDQEGIIRPIIEGPEILTGGSFGLEASIVSIVICLFISYYFIQLAIIEKKIVLPVWKRNKLDN
jgi:membrane protease YdiL (CAAX protease family)